MDAWNFVDDRNVLLTGATSGIGLAAAEEFCARGWLVLGVGLADEDCRRAEASIRRFCPQARLVFFVADLSSRDAVDRLAADVGRYLDAHCGSRLDVLVNDAGIVTSRFTETVDGLEMQFAVNHLAAFRLSGRMLPWLRRSPAGRILSVTSRQHRMIRMHWRDPLFRRHYRCLAVYRQSKLALALFSHEFNRRETASPVRSYLVDPALVNTRIGSSNSQGIVAWFWERRRRKGVSPHQAACTMIFLVKQPSDWRPEETYYQNCAPLAPSRYSQDPEMGARLWDLSVALGHLDGTDHPFADPGALGRKAAGRG